MPLSAPEGEAIPSDSVQMRCKLCGSTSRNDVLRISDAFSLVRCGDCGLVATFPPVPATEIGRYYPASYYGENNRRFNALLEGLIPFFRNRRARAIEKFVPKGRILDVGCGRGILPTLMRERGWEVDALEFSETAARHARDELQLPVFVGDFVQSPYPDSSFDAVVLWHVLEHLPDPAAAIRRARQILRPGGFLIVAVPNFESLQARCTGRHWFHLDVPRHYHHFGLTVLRRLLTTNGFSIVDVSHLSIEYNPYGWIQSLLNGLGFRYNLLYDLLKNRSARSLQDPLRAAPAQLLLTLAALPVIVPMSFGLTLLEVLLRRGGTVEMYARRDK
jgi:2-polyprenyl-3-methyl-5-hydroxy-6-metoxy-1,4-benzoquinol methylase